ncbi:MAG: 23S rRNA (pseudouridine(1915)-N(3))-methyltransferase RlmH [Pyrinomonadaceae bacterium]
MHFRFIWVGKTREANLRGLIDEYLQRLGRFIRCEISELRDAGGSDGSADEGRRIIAALRPSSIVVALEVTGRQWDSHELAAQVEEWQVSGAKEIAFIIGGPTGLAEEVRDRANIRWSLSRLTLTHEMARLLMAEQLYRAFTIIRGLPYQK